MISQKLIDNSFSLYEREAFLKHFTELSDKPCVSILTCNRLEIYSGDGEIPSAITEHVFRLVAGLKSSLLGEIAIQGQVKKAYLEASSKYNLSKSLHQLFQYALFVGKKVRTESGISRGAVSHSQAALEIILDSGINLNKALITLIGAPKLNEDIIKYLLSKGAETIFLGSRSFEKADAMAKKFNCKAFRLDQLYEFLSFTDILISATSAPHLIVKESNFPKDKKMIILDLAFPRDIDQKIGEMDKVTLYNLEDIEQRVCQNIDKRKNTIEKAEVIINEEITRFYQKLKSDRYVCTH